VFKVFSLPLAALVFFLTVGIAYAQQDITPPSLVSVSFAPAQVDTSNGPATITITAHVTDDLSGVEDVTLYFRSLESVQHFVLDFDVKKERKSGDAQDGFYVATVTLPQYAAYGDWKMTTFGLTDSAGNYATGIRSFFPDPESHWLPQYDSIRFHNGPVIAPLLSANHLFLPALANF
jgi:hypothetical protein